MFNSHSEEIATQLDAVTDACGPRSNCTPISAFPQSTITVIRGIGFQKNPKCPKPHFADEKAFRAIYTEQ